MAESNSASLTFAKTFLDAMLAANNHTTFGNELFKDMTVVSVSENPRPRVVTRLTVTPGMCNPGGALHGGAICTLFDICTTVALVTAREWETPGVTRTLSTTCLVPVLPGQEIEIESELLQIGKRFAHILAKMTLVKNGKLVATAVHDKVNVESQAAMPGQASKL